MKFQVWILPLLILVGGCATVPPGTGGGTLDFALIGDTPYTPQQETNLFPNMIEDLNAAELAFVVHVGDIKSGGTPCTDEVFIARAKQFASFKHPLIYTPGDNEWTDCGRFGSDPLERLEKLRELFMHGDETLGQRHLKLTRQSSSERYASFRENVRWVMGRVTFACINVPGDKNNFGEPEYTERNAANLAWLRETFAAARRSEHRAVMIVCQANPFPERGSTNRVAPGFRDMLRLLEEETVAFGRPVVLVHGDSHYFRIDKPLSGSVSRRRIENFTRVETFGDPDVHWLRVTVDSNDPNVFTFHPQYVRKNLVKHSDR
jgi:hypothetical protein